MDHFTGTRPLTEGQALDLPSLQAYLVRHLPGFQGPLRVEQFKGGQSNPTYLLTTPGTRYVMRSKPGPAAVLLPSAHAIEREFRVMDALGGTDVPVARMLALCEDESVIGRAFYIMEFVDGRVLWDSALPGMTPAERAAHYDEMNRVIAALHSVDVGRAGLSDFGRPGSYFERQIGRWSRQYEASRTEPLPAMEQLVEWLPAHLPASARDEASVSIVHGDFRVDNLIFDHQQARVQAVIDWELSTLGHPLADFSYHCMMWHVPPGVFRGLGGLDVQALGIPTEAEHVRRYCERTGRQDPQAVMADWNFYLAYNLFRLAAITQGIAKRIQVGTASSEQARATAAATPALARLAWDFAQACG